MAGNKTPGPMCQVADPVEVDDGTMCLAASPPPRSTGTNAGQSAPFSSISGQYISLQVANQQAQGSPADDKPISGAIPASLFFASSIRIPVPGSGGLFIELSPRGWVPPSGSTSAVFIQDLSGKRTLRLDYGYNKVTQSVDYHWNQQGTFSEFGIADHTPAAAWETVLYKGARYFKFAGRVFLVAGVAVDVYSIVVAKKRWRQVVKVAAGLAGAWAGCEAGGYGGAAAGTAVEPGGGTV